MKDPREEIEKMSSAYQKSLGWYTETYIDNKKPPEEEYNGRDFIPGKIYTYQYDPITKDKLAFYDNHPIMLCIGHIETKKGRKNAFGINLSFIPPKYRAAIMQKIWKVFNNNVIAKNEEFLKDGKKFQKEMPIYYEVCKYILRNSGFEFALRSYIYDQMESKPMIIPYNHWFKILAFPSQFIKLISIRAIYIRYKKNVDKSYRVGKKESVIKLKNTMKKKLNKL